MTRKTIILATCLILAVALAASVACISKADSKAPAPAKTVAGFPFVKIGGVYDFPAPKGGSTSVHVEKDLGGGWIETTIRGDGQTPGPKTLFLNLSLTSQFYDEGASY